MAHLPYKLRDWINKDELLWYKLCQNPRAIDLIKQNPDKKIDWGELSFNENAIELLEQNLHNIEWTFLAMENKNALELLQKYSKKLAYNTKINCLCMNESPDAIYFINNEIKKNKHIIEELDWVALSCNPNAIDILEENQDFIDWYWISKNPNAIHLIQKHIEEKGENSNELNYELLSTNPNAISILKKYPHMIDWDWLSTNPNAMEMLQQNPDNISWTLLSQNPNPIAIQMLKDNPDAINWSQLLYNKNPDVMVLVEQNWKTLLKKYENRDEHHGFWQHVSLNQNIFVLDYSRMKQNRSQLNREIIEAAMHPNRIAKWLEQGIEPDDL